MVFTEEDEDAERKGNMSDEEHIPAPRRIFEINTDF